MTSLCIQDLVNATDGKLRLGMMPPLGGRMAPIRRLALGKNPIQIGDAVFATAGEMTSGTDALSSHSCPNELFAMGASGVITEEDVCPWDGKFSLQVSDMNNSQRSLFRFVRDRMSGPVVAVLDDRADSGLVRSLRQHVGGAEQMDDLPPEQVSEADQSVMWQVLGAPPDSEAIVTHVPAGQPEGTLALLRPNVVVATGAVSSSEISRVIGLAGENGILVLEESEIADAGSKFDRATLPSSWQFVSANVIRLDDVDSSPSESTLIAQVAISVITRTLCEMSEGTENESRAA